MLGNTNTRLDHAADPRYRDPGGGLVLAVMLPPVKGLKRGKGWWESSPSPWEAME